VDGGGQPHRTLTGEEFVDLLSFKFISGEISKILKEGTPLKSRYRVKSLLMVEMRGRWSGSDWSGVKWEVG
jgi:hypothetical protein